MMDKNEYLKQKRMERIMALQGKCVIVADSPKNKGQIVYLQDQELCSKGFWTAFLANAKGYDTEAEAMVMLRKLKYNNPRIMWIS